MSVIIEWQTYHTFEEAYDITGKHIDESAESLYKRLLERNKQVIN